jgi:hypothetical protein
LLEKTKLGELTLSYMDEAGFVQTQPNRSAWTETGEVHLITAARGKRLNVMAALISTGELFTAKFWETTTAALFGGFLGLLLESVGRPLTVILDNASIHKAKEIQPLLALLKQKGLTLYFLPPYGCRRRSIMAMRVKPDTGEVGLKQRYRVTNWSEYDRALVNRGNLTSGSTTRVFRDQWTPAPPLGRGKPGRYSETAIQTCLTIKRLFQLPYRATEGLLKSLMRLCQLDLPVPDHTHMSRRAAQLSVKIPRRPRKGPTHVVVDSTGLKIFGEGEWKVRQHGVGKRRTWRKVHLAVDETSKDIIGIEVTTTAWGDSEILPGLLDQVEARSPKSRPMAPTTATAAMRR